MEGGKGWGLTITISLGTLALTPSLFSRFFFSLLFLFYFIFLWVQRGGERVMLAQEPRRQGLAAQPIGVWQRSPA